MKHNKWMKALCCGLALIMLTCLLAVSGAAAETLKYNAVVSVKDGQTTTAVKNADGSVSPAVVTLDIDITLSAGETLKEAKIVANNFSTDARRVGYVIPAYDADKTTEAYFKNESGKALIHFSNLHFWGDERVLQLSLVTSTPDETEDSIALNVPLNQLKITSETAPTPAPLPQDASAPYLSGYTLTQANGLEIPGELIEGQRCNVVLRITDPALANRSMSIDRICTKLNCASFTFTGLGEISHQDDTSFIAIFRDAIYNGRSSDIKVDLWYKDSDLPMRTISASFGALNSDPASDIKHTSNIIVRDVDYGREVIAGQPFTLNLTLFSSIGDENISDIIVRLELPEDISVVNGSESGYITNMAPRSTASVSFVLQPKVNIEKTTVNIGVDISGTGAVSYAAVTASPTISIPITQPIRFEFTNLEAPSDLMAGVEDVVSATYVNKGKNTLSNVTATLTGSNLMNGEQSQYLGNVESGSEKSVEFNISALEAGSVNGLLTLTYEDSNGQEQSISRAFSCSVEEMPVYQDWGTDMPIEEPTPAGPPLWLYLLLGLLVILGGFLGFKVWKRHAAKKAAAKAEEDDEDDSSDNFQYRPLPSANEGSAHEVH